MTIRPLNSNYHIRLLDPEEKTAGGIWLPQSAQENWTTGEILAAGPGYARPDTDRRSLMDLEPGDLVCFFQHDYRMMDEREGMVRDEDIIAYVDEGVFAPWNDWVKLELLDNSHLTNSGLIIPENVQKKANVGRVRNWGPGYLRLKGEYYGTRKSVAGIMGISASAFAGHLFYWADDADALDIAWDGQQAVFVRAGDLLIHKSLEETR